MTDDMIDFDNDVLGNLGFHRLAVDHLDKGDTLIIGLQSKIKLALSMYDSKVCSISQILETTGISKTTLYRYIRQRNANQ